MKLLLQLQLQERQRRRRRRLRQGQLPFQAVILAVPLARCQQLQQRRCRLVPFLSSPLLPRLPPSEPMHGCEKNDHRQRPQEENCTRRRRRGLASSGATREDRFIWPSTWCKDANDACSSTAKFHSLAVVLGARGFFAHFFTLDSDDVEQHAQSAAEARPGQEAPPHQRETSVEGNLLSRVITGLQ